MPDAATLDAISKLGAGALFALAVFAFYTRRVRTSGEAQEDKAEADARLSEMRADRDRWRAIAEAYGTKLDELTATLATLVAAMSKVDRLLELVEWIRSKFGRLLDLVERIAGRVAP